MLFKKSKIRVFKTPSKKEPAKVHIGIPDEIKLHPKVPALSIKQVEILPKPKSFLDLRKAPKVIDRPAINAFKSVGKTLLEPGHKLVIRPIALMPPLMLQPIKVEEVILPKGFIHLDDINDWEIFNYNKAWQLSDRDFEVLPGEEKLPKIYSYQLIEKYSVFTVLHDDPITDVKVYYRRLNDRANRFEWIDWTSISKNSTGVEFPYKGKFEFRAVPRHLGRPLPMYYDQIIEFEEEEDLWWTSLQLDEDSFQIRVEGQIPNTINQLEVIENNVLVATRALNPTSTGRIETEFIINNISDALDPELEFRFYRTYPGGKSFNFKDFHTLKRYHAYEDVEIRVEKISNTMFSIYIEDTKEKMYSPDSPISPFTGAQWNEAVQSGQLITKLEIIRHQDGETTNYGTYYTNITGEIEPNFLQAPPFTKGVERIDKGFQFTFEDTQAFRDVANLSTPDSDKKLAYEFRLVFWSAGVEESLRTKNEYSFIKEDPILVRNTRATHKFNYNCWKEEHPRRKYYGVIPVDVQYSYLGHHVEFGRSKDAIILNAGRLPVKATTDVEIQKKGWKVLYYYNDKEDEIQKFPYHSFDIKVPTSTQLSLTAIEIEIENGDKDILLGVYHPSDVISIVDFLGYYESRKLITKRINFMPAFNKFDDVVRPRKQLLTSKAKRKMIEPIRKKELLKSKTYRSISLITPEQKNESKKTNMFINREIAKVIETGILKYNVNLIFHNGKIITKEVTARILDIPKEPPEPSNNLSISIGNRTVLPKTFEVPKPIGKLLVDQVRKISPKKISKIRKISKKKGLRK